MSYQLYPSDLADREWHVIKPMLPLAKRGGRPRSTDMRLVWCDSIYARSGLPEWTRALRARRKLRLEVVKRPAGQRELCSAAPALGGRAHLRVAWVPSASEQG